MSRSITFTTRYVLGPASYTLTTQPVAIPSYLIAIAAGNLVYKSFKDIPGKTWKTGVWTEVGYLLLLLALADDASPRSWTRLSGSSRRIPLGTRSACAIADFSSFVATAEELTSPYQFGVYDILLLPPSFPYGGMLPTLHHRTTDLSGMENACLTFATPTLLAHDRSLVDVCAHEISHVSHTPTS